MRSGFVLIELVVVMVILSVLFISFMPKITSFLASEESDEIVKVLNQITQKAYKDSVNKGHFSVVWGIKGSRNIYYNGRCYTLPQEVFSVKVNRKLQEGLKYYFLIYPDGIMDKVKIVFEDGRVVISDPLLLRWR